MEFAVITDLVILAGALAFVGWPLANPLLAEGEATARQKRRTALEEEKERVFSALADLDHDRATGKMEESDHAMLTAKLKAEAARILRELDVNDGRRTLKAGETLEPKAAEPKPAARAKRVEPPPRPIEPGDVVAHDDAPTVPGVKPRSLDDVADAVKFCTKCGRRAKSADDRFCGRCGAALPED